MYRALALVASMGAVLALHPIQVRLFGAHVSAGVDVKEMPLGAGQAPVGFATEAGLTGGVARGAGLQGLVEKIPCPWAVPAFLQDTRPSS